MNSKPELRVEWATPAATAFAVRHWHYSRSMPVPPRVALGAWEDGVFVGAVLFSRGSCLNLLRPYGIDDVDGCELTRVALNMHRSPVTRIIAIAIRMLSSSNPGLRLIVSFADPMHGHHGGIYQGGGWIYSGTTSPDYFHVDINGKKWHSRQVRKSGTPVRQFGQYRAMPSPERMTLVETLGKHRYLMPLDAAMRAQIEPLAKPYPKRTTRTKEQAAGFPPALDGAVPIRALQQEAA